MIKKALILAAGRGQRMGELTRTTPKPLLKVNGKELIVWQIERLIAAEISNVVINTAYLGQQICDFLGDGSRFGICIEYSREELDGFPDGLETAGGIIKALPLLGEAFVVINADLWTDFPLSKLMQKYRGESAFLVLVDNPPWKNHGDFSLCNNQVELGNSYTFAGISIFHARFFSGMNIEFQPLAPILRAAIMRREVCGLHYPGVWEDIGTPERLALVLRDRMGRF